jgi:hypothetical protein
MWEAEWLLRWKMAPRGLLAMEGRVQEKESGPRRCVLLDGAN